MVGEVFEGTIWFNSSKKAMEKKLLETKQNSGVGINIGRFNHFFNPNIRYVNLKFDDGSSGQALVQKDSWGNCTHLIQECIGLWARKNGLWELKLTSRTVPVKLKVIRDKKEFCVFK